MRIKILRINTLLFCTMLIAASFVGCKEFFEPPLTNKSVNLVAPASGIETTSYQVNFLWEKHPDAITYRLQVATPTFDRVEKLLLDTIVKADKFTYTLDPGRYEWRVKAENGSSETAYSTRSFTIYPSSLTDQVVQIKSPGNSTILIVPNVNFEWLPLFGANEYRLQIDKNNFIDPNALVFDQSFTATQAAFQLPAEGTYQFRVQATNQTETSKWSTVRNFTFDATPPVKVVLSTPSNAQTVASPARLTWGSVADAEKYELFIYKSDSVTLVNSTFPTLVNTNAFSFSLGNSQETFYWRVRAIDKAGNKGELSNMFSFTIQ